MRSIKNSAGFFFRKRDDNHNSTKSTEVVIENKNKEIKILKDKIKKLEEEQTHNLSESFIYRNDDDVIRSSLSVNSIPSINEYVIQQTISRGSSGIVYKAMNTNNGEFRAIKKIAIKKGNTSEIENEIKILIRLGNHPYIVRLYEYIEHESHFYLILELCKEPIMQMLPIKQPHIKNPYLRRYSQQIISALDFLHDNNIYHQDLKPENVLLTFRGQIRLSDFGLAKIGDDKFKTGTLYSMAPEVLQVETCNIDGKLADIWSLGVTIYCLGAGEYPFYAQGIYPLMNKILNDKIKYPIHFDDDLSFFLEGLLTKNISKRSCMEKIKNNVWLTNCGKEVFSFDNQIKSFRRKSTGTELSNNSLISNISRLSMPDDKYISHTNSDTLLLYDRNIHLEKIWQKRKKMLSDRNSKSKSAETIHENPYTKILNV